MATPFVTFIGKHGSLPTPENFEMVTAPLFSLKLTRETDRINNHHTNTQEKFFVKVSGDTYAYRVEREVYDKLLKMLSDKVALPRWS